MLLLRGPQKANVHRDFEYSTVCEVIIFIGWWAVGRASWGALGFARVGLLVGGGFGHGGSVPLLVVGVIWG